MKNAKLSRVILRSNAVYTKSSALMTLTQQKIIIIITIIINITVIVNIIITIINTTVLITINT